MVKKINIFILALTSSALSAQTEPTFEQTGITISGATFTFGSTETVGFFDTTDHDGVHGWVYNPVGGDGVAITGDTPASASLDGGIKDGIMRDPYLGGTGPQGWDQFLTGSSQHGTKNTSYDAALNIAPSITGSNITLPAGEEASFVKTIRLASVTDANSWQTIEKYVHLHVVDTIPLVGAYPPSPTSLDKTMRNRSEVNLDVLRSLTFPASFDESYTYLSDRIPSSIAHWGRIAADSYRALRLDAAINSAADTNYSGHYAAFYSRYLMLLHSDAITAAERLEIADKAIIHGLQLHGLVSRGNPYLWNFAGQGGGILPWMYYSAALLDDATLWNNAKTTRLQPYDAEWLTEKTVGRPSEGKVFSNSQTAFEGHIGVPIHIPDEWGTNLDTRYGPIATNYSAYEALVVSMLQAGANTEAGDVGLLRGATANDTVDNDSALVALMDRVRTWVPWTSGVGNRYDVGSVWRDMYDLARPLFGASSWSGRPDQIKVIPDYEPFLFTTGEGAFSWDISTYDYATEAITRNDVRYSLDSVQWIEVSDVGTTGTVTGLTKGAPHWVGVRRVSATGAAPWSWNYKKEYVSTQFDRIGPEYDRNVLTPTGTAADSIPVNTLTPVIHARLHPAWDYPVWKEEKTSEDIEYAAGVGYWSGYPAPTYTYQWQRDGVDMVGETSRTYTRVSSDSGTTLTCDITATNSSGSVTVSTAAYLVPAVQGPPSGSIIDTNFQGAFVINYETEWESIVTDSSTARHEPTEGFANYSIGDLSVGALMVDKNSSTTSLRMDLSRPLVAGETYTLTAEFVAVAYWSGNLFFNLRKQATGGSYFSEGQFSVAPNPPEVITLVREFTVSEGETNLAAYVYFGNSSLSGGTAGGDVYLTYLQIAKKVSESIPLSGKILKLGNSGRLDGALKTNDSSRLKATLRN